MKIFLLVLVTLSTVDCINQSALTSDQLEQLSSMGYALNQSLVYNLFPQWNNSLIRQNKHMKYRFNLCYDPSIGDKAQIDLFEDRLDDALNVYFAIYLDQNGLKTVPFERITIFLANTVNFLNSLKKCVFSKRDQVNKLGINSHFVFDQNEFSQLDLGDFLNSKKPLGSKESYTNRIDSCEIVMKNSEDVKLPSSFNWVDHGAVTPVKEQGHCGSCVVFGSIASAEAAYHLQMQQPLSNFSEQDVLNCFANFGRGGCFASWPDDVLEFIMSRGFVESKGWYGNKSLDSDYKAKVMECEAKPNQPVHKIEDYCFYVNVIDDQTLLKMVYHLGPLVVPISSYDETIFYLKNTSYVTGCGKRQKGHVLSLVGWNEENFLLKNSWSKDWSNEGYLHLARNKDNQKCGYRNFAAVPIFKKFNYSLGASLFSN